MTIPRGPDLPEHTTDEILQRSVKGDMDAFRTLVELHQTFAYRLAYRLLGSDEEAKDIVQESFIRVWRHLPKYRANGKFTTWLYSIVTNLCYDRMKARKRRSKVIRTLEQPFSAFVASTDTLEGDIEAKDIARLILITAEALAAKQRLVFILRDVEDLSIAEVAQITGMSKGSVKSNLCHARHNIRIKLEKANKSMGI